MWVLKYFYLKFFLSKYPPNRSSVIIHAQPRSRSRRMFHFTLNSSKKQKIELLQIACSDISFSLVEKRGLPRKDMFHWLRLTFRTVSLGAAKCFSETSLTSKVPIKNKNIKYYLFLRLKYIYGLFSAIQWLKQSMVAG